MKVIEYLKNHSYDDLKNELGIESKVYNDRVVLNYSQTDSPKYDPIVKECRALILNRPNHKVLCRSFDRFYNYGEDPNTEKFKINRSVVEEKIDGSLCCVYNDGNKWQVSTRKMAFAEGETFTGKTFKEIFIEALGGDPNEIFKTINTDLVIIFELVSPETRVVKPYEETLVYLLDIRNRVTGSWLGNEESWFWNIPSKAKWRYPKKFKFENWEECLYALKELPALDEGYVARLMGWRIKIKNPSYLAIANLRLNGVLSEKRLIKLVLLNDYDEYLNYFPEDKKNFEPYIEAYKNMIIDIDAKWIAYKNLENDKDFALAIKNCPAKNILFGMRKKGMKISEVIDKMTDNSKYFLLKSYVREVVK